MSGELVFGVAKNFRKAVALTDAYAASEWPLLILGETGVGKELIARRAHEKSHRSRATFLPVNCAAIPSGLFESELFGFEKGAFSGALQSSRGILRQANGGTVFLDEIGELDISLQVKLLRLLDSGEVRAVGSTRVESVNVRVVAATNVDLYRAVADGRFRRDLLERLSVLTVQVPSLRSRPEDISLIAAHWLQKLGARYETGALKALEGYEWPGNIRQLRNVLVRASVSGGKAITEALLNELVTDEQARGATSGSPLDSMEGSLAEIEKQVIVQKLRQCRGNRKRTAEELGIAKSTLHEKIRRWRQSPGDDGSWPLSRYAPGPTLSV